MTYHTNYFLRIGTFLWLPIKSSKHPQWRICFFETRYLVLFFTIMHIYYSPLIHIVKRTPSWVMDVSLIFYINDTPSILYLTKIYSNRFLSRSHKRAEHNINVKIRHVTCSTKNMGQFWIDAHKFRKRINVKRSEKIPGPLKTNLKQTRGQNGSP